MLERLSDLGLNTVRIWLEPDDFFPVSTSLDRAATDKLDRLLTAGAERGVRFVIGMHLACAPEKRRPARHEPRSASARSEAAP